MSVSYNRVILAGNITRDPELRFTQGGVPVCGFGIAVNRVRSQNDEVDFFDVSAWRELGETVANYKKKGDPILVEGRLQYRTWEDRESGQKRSKVDVTAENVQFLSGGRSEDNGSGGGGGGGSRQSSGNGASGGRRGSRQEDVDISSEDFEDIPFGAEPRAKTRIVEGIL